MCCYYLHLPVMKYPFPDNKILQGVVVAFTIFMSMLVGLVFATFLVKFTLPVFFGIADAGGFMNSPTEQMGNSAASLYIQAWMSIGIFFFPALSFPALFRMPIAGRLKLNSLPSLKYWLVAIVVMIAAGIFIQLLVQVMQAIPLPASMSSLRSKGELILKLEESFFVTRSGSYFLILTLCMALIPAMGEELFFRGTLQNVLSDFRLTPISAILIAALGFAAMHMQFDNLLGIWCMGIVLGLLYFYTDSLWVCIVAHFLNNFMVVAGKYAYMAGTLKSDILSADTLPLYYTIPAGLIMVGGLVILSKWSGKKVTDLPN
jgi:membrane protease YdiL (CAAX protease family)